MSQLAHTLWDPMGAVDSWTQLLWISSRSCPMRWTWRRCTRFAVNRAGPTYKRICADWSLIILKLETNFRKAQGDSRSFTVLLFFFCGSALKCIISNCLFWQFSPALSRWTVGVADGDLRCLQWQLGGQWAWPKSQPSYSPVLYSCSQTWCSNVTQRKSKWCKWGVWESFLVLLTPVLWLCCDLAASQRHALFAPLERRTKDHIQKIRQGQGDEGEPGCRRALSDFLHGWGHVRPFTSGW